MSACAESCSQTRIFLQLAYLEFEGFAHLLI